MISQQPPDQAERLRQILQAMPEEPGRRRLCQDCHEQPVAYRGLGICRKCYLRKERGSTPRYVGQCRQPGCPKPGRGRSGYCRGHYQQGWHRAWRWRSVLQRHLGTSLTVEDVRRGLDEATAATPAGIEALAVVRSLLEQIGQGQMTLAKSPWGARR